jgi:3-oxoadipate enol-lactonase
MLNVAVDGAEDAPVVLTWNGAMCTLRMWDAVVPKLNDQFRMIRIDTRGVGQSTVTTDAESQYTFEQYAEDANRVLDQFGVERCHIWSMAWGSRAALAYCSLYPQRVISAALFDANTGPADVAAQREGGKKAMELQLAAGIERFPRPDGWNTHDNPQAAQRAMTAAGRIDLPGAAPRLTMPALVATGDHDPNLPPSRELVAKAPNASLVVMENVGHGSVLQRPDLTTEIFLEFQASLA